VSIKQTFFAKQIFAGAQLLSKYLLFDFTNIIYTIATKGQKMSFLPKTDHPLPNTVCCLPNLCAKKASHLVC